MSHDQRPDDLARQAAGEPPHSLGARAEGEGTVKWWNEQKGYGAIACPATSPWDVWCHFSAIEGFGYRALVPGERVAVDYWRADQASFRYIAQSVRRAGPRGEEGQNSPAAG